MLSFFHRQWILPGLVAGSTFWAGGLWAAPSVVGSSGVGAGLSAAAYAIGAVICHQRPERSLHVAGAQMPACARCAGLYVGGALGLLGWAAWRRVRSHTARLLDARNVARVVALSAAPTAIAILTAALGWWDVANGGRAVLAIPLGIAAGAVLAAVAAEDLR